MPESDILKPGRTTSLGLQTLGSIFDYAVENFGQSVSMKSHYPWGYQSISYQELGRLINFLGAGFVASGLEKGDRVALIAKNSPEWTIVYAAVTSCGGVIVPLDIQLMENEIRHLLLHSEAKHIITTPGIYSEKLEDMRLEGVVRIVIGDETSIQGVVTLGELMALGKRKINDGDGDYFRRKSEVRPDDLAAVCYTSGTTAQSKGVKLLHRNITSNITAIHRALPLRNDDVYLGLLPLYHTFATMGNFLIPLSTGGMIIFGRSFKPRDIREDIMRERVTIITGVPLLFSHMAAALRREIDEAPKRKQFLFRVLSGISSGLGRLFRKNVGRAVFKNRLSESGLGSIRFCISGGAHLRPDVEESFNSIGLPMLQGYGITETSPVISVNPLGKAKRGTVGPPLPGIDVKIKDMNDEGIGEILVRGPSVMQGYYKNDEATAAVIKDGWFHSGDLGMIDRDGYITIAGRKKSVIVTSGGKNVYPVELETLISSSPYVLECVVLPIKDHKGNDAVGAIIVPDYDALGATEKLKGDKSEETIHSVIREEIRNVCSQIPEYKHISDFLIRDQELPKTTTHKIRRHLVQWIEE